MNVQELINSLEPFILYNWDNGSRTFDFPFEITDMDMLKSMRELISMFDLYDGVSVRNTSTDLRTGEYDRFVVAAERKLQELHPNMKISLDYVFEVDWQYVTYTVEQSELYKIPVSVYDRDGYYSGKRRQYASYVGTYVKVAFN